MAPATSKNIWREGLKKRYKGSAFGLGKEIGRKVWWVPVFSDDEDNFDVGDVAEPGMNGVCARPIGPSDLLYGGTTYCT